MRSLLNRFGPALLVLLLLPACSVDPDEAAPATPPDILARLQAIEGLTVQEVTTSRAGYRYFLLEIEQPADHDDPDGPRFHQRMALLHTREDAPFILGTAGYFINPAFAYLTEPAALLEANQLMVEHRFFVPSRPEPADWSDLTITQAAADDHRIVEALRPIYTGKWISTGTSKGGMTSIYHRRFYPDDVDGTVAYVAPQTFGTSDPRYIDFVAQLGDPACRQSLLDFQREVLLRRPAMMAHLSDQATQDELTYDLLGADQALEVAAVELPFTFWQYFDASRCPDIPTAASTDDDVWGFLDEINPPAFWADDGFLDFEPYFWQAAVELGYPALDESNVSDLLMFPGIDVPATFVVPGPGKTPTFHPDAMLDIDAWVKSEGEALLFVYGENDPYSAAAFDLGAAKDAYRFFVPSGNHGSKILDLPAADRDVALHALEAWSGVTPVVPAGTKSTHEPAFLRRFPL